VDRLWSFLSNLKANDENGSVGIPDDRPIDDAVKAIAKEALGGNKGAGWSARLFEECEFHELPVTVTNFLASVFALFPPPPAIDDDKAPPDAAVAP
jgi:putative ATP-dependent endonuclease of OLD family